MREYRNPAAVWLLLCVVVASGPAWAAPSERSATTRPASFEETPTARPYVPQFNTFAHRTLDFEAAAEPIDQQKYQLLDKVIAAAKAAVRFDPSIAEPEARRNQAIRVLQEIDKVFVQHNFIYPPGEWTQTLGVGLTPRTLSDDDFEKALIVDANTRRREHMLAHRKEEFYFIDCDIGCFLYMAVAEVLGFELKLVEVPKHNFIRWHFNSSSFLNRETTSGTERSDEYYWLGFGVTDRQLRDRVYMVSMSDSEVSGYLHLLRASRFEKQKKFRQAVDDYNRAIELSPQAPLPRNNLAWLYVSRPEYDKSVMRDALSNSLKAVSEEPFNANFVDTLACAYAENGDYELAVAMAEFAVRRSVGTEKTEFESRLKLFRQRKTYRSTLKEGNE